MRGREGGGGGGGRASPAHATHHPTARFIADLHLGVRSQKTRKLAAFISGIPADMRVHEETTRMVEINFLCVHKKLRSKVSVSPKSSSERQQTLPLKGQARCRPKMNI